MIVRLLTIGAILVGSAATNYTLFHKEGDENIHGIKDLVLIYT